MLTSSRAVWGAVALVAVVSFVAPGAAPVRAAAPATDAAVTAGDPAAFINDVASRAIALLQNASLAPAEREMRLRELARQSFDTEGITRFLAGRPWKDASEEERRAFGPLLEDYVLRVYASRVGVMEKAPRLTIKAVRQEGAASTVASEFVRPEGGPPARVDWRVVKKAEGWRIADVSVDGISLAMTQRDEFAAVMQRNGGGLNGLMQVIRQRIAEANAGK